MAIGDQAPGGQLHRGDPGGVYAGMGGGCDLNQAVDREVRDE